MTDKKQTKVKKQLQPPVAEEKTDEDKFDVKEVMSLVDQKSLEFLQTKMLLECRAMLDDKMLTIRECRATLELPLLKDERLIKKLKRLQESTRYKLVTLRVELSDGTIHRLLCKYNLLTKDLSPCVIRTQHYVNLY